jgi:hypothetical protein
LSSSPHAVLPKVLSEKERRTGGVAQVEECLPRKHKFKLQNYQKKKKKKKKFKFPYGIGPPTPLIFVNATILCCGFGEPRVG